MYKEKQLKVWNKPIIFIENMIRSKITARLKTIFSQPYSKYFNLFIFSSLCSRIGCIYGFFFLVILTQNGGIKTLFDVDYTPKSIVKILMNMHCSFQPRLIIIIT